MSRDKQPKRPPSFATLVQTYFAEYLTQQRALSPQTIAAYRDAFVLFLAFAKYHLGYHLPVLAGIHRKSQKVYPRNVQAVFQPLI